VGLAAPIAAVAIKQKCMAPIEALLKLQSGNNERALRGSPSHAAFAELKGPFDRQKDPPAQSRTISNAQQRARRDPPPA